MTDFDYRTVHASQLPELSSVLPTVLAGDWSESALRTMQAAGHQLRVLNHRQEIVAFAEFQWVLDECQLFNIAVLPDWRRQGLGRLLLRELLQESAQAGMKSCVLEVRESNAAARGLYRQCGFMEAGRRPAYYPPPQSGADREAAVLYGCGL
ncbi:MAG TPA: ribosomal protein S18-alanine N-acetyltransferase [Candidatus Acidoferrum sp.]|nr:ribosomal protein S18-alanine N-acetyltransferase [Candidatus Acidoferrum sp.]